MKGFRVSSAAVVAALSLVSINSNGLTSVQAEMPVLSDDHTVSFGLDFLKSVVGQILPAADEQGIEPTPREEMERQRQLRNAKSLVEALDYMTPAEVQAALGLPASDLAENLSDDELIQKAALSGGWLKIDVSRASQTLEMQGSQTDRFTEPVSTGRPGYTTPAGCHHPYSLQRMHYSRKYDNAPMPWSVFFVGGIALHQTYDVGHLGQPASHGCVRQDARAQQVYATVSNYVKKYGRSSIVICVR